MEANYWTMAPRRLSRRRILAAAAATGGIAGLALAGCGSQSKASNASGQKAASSGSSGTPQAGGNLNVYVAQNSPLDTQKVSGGAQAVPGTVMSRVFQFKTSTDPLTITDHDSSPTSV